MSTLTFLLVQYHLASLVLNDIWFMLIQSRSAVVSLKDGWDPQISYLEAVEK